jgi:uncharacterized protein (TIGR03083 family)
LTAPSSPTGAVPSVQTLGALRQSPLLDRERKTRPNRPGQTWSVDDAEMLRTVVADVGSVANALGHAPEAPVAHCPGWTVADLVGHHGGVLRWAEAIVRTGEPLADSFQPPEGHDELRSWYVGAADEFVGTVSITDRDRDCWTFGRPPGRVWFWTRRQAVEAAVHRWDTEFASRGMAKIRTDVACMGIEEVVSDLFPRQVALARTAELSCGVELRASDVGRRWALSPNSEATGAVVEAPADVILLFLWRRATHDDPRIGFTGSERVLDELRAARFAP